MTEAQYTSHKTVILRRISLFTTTSSRIQVAKNFRLSLL